MDSKDLHAISHYVNYKIREIGSDIIMGNIAVNPYERGQADSCMYCSYAGICGYDNKIVGYQKRKLEDSDKEEIMERIRTKVKEEH